LNIHIYPSAGTVTDRSEGSCQQFQSHSSDCQLVLTKFDIIHRIDLGKFLPCPSDAVFAMDPHINSVSVCRCNWTG